MVLTADHALEMAPARISACMKSGMLTLLSFSHSKRASNYKRQVEVGERRIRRMHQAVSASIGRGCCTSGGGSMNPGIIVHKGQCVWS